MYEVSLEGQKGKRHDKYILKGFFLAYIHKGNNFLAIEMA